jgi:hypothetical protein
VSDQENRALDTLGPIQRELFEALGDARVAFVKSEAVQSAIDKVFAIHDIEVVKTKIAAVKTDAEYLAIRDRAADEALALLKKDGALFDSVLAAMLDEIKRDEGVVKHD